ncbi:hypothetical protein SKAU_G00399540 [Synaphobranchus kaupii]|uniref:Uncharacterized protein n=1 Tax=Synaphobranchus kaupii TaxID=118154 RepID=A0A9Q1E8S3_SYNKA|nr:hypothetical protein SKAU_G00399540 [Synaphobranchus kaupii]
MHTSLRHQEFHEKRSILEQLCLRNDILQTLIRSSGHFLKDADACKSCRSRAPRDTGSLRPAAGTRRQRRCGVPDAPGETAPQRGESLPDVTPRFLTNTSPSPLGCLENAELPAIKNPICSITALKLQIDNQVCPLLADPVSSGSVDTQNNCCVIRS